MTDKAISALASVSVPSGTDVLPIVNGGATKKVDLTTLFTKIPGNISYSGVRMYSTAPETIGTAGAVSVDSEYSFLSNVSASPFSVTLANGQHGQIKKLACIAADQTVTLTATQSAFTSIVFNSIGDTVTLEYISNKWYIMGSNGVVIN